MKQVNVVLQRGLLGNAYSKGMDALGAKLAKVPGVDYVSVEDYSNWRSVRDRVARWNDPTILIGHSFGANAATKIATQVSKEIPLIVSFDASPYWSWWLLQRGWSYIAPNVKHVVNFFQYGLPIGNQQLTRNRSGDVTGIENIVVDTTHTDIDDMEILHQRAINEVKAIINV